MKKIFLLCGIVAAFGLSTSPMAGRADTVLAKKGDLVNGTLLQTLSSKTSHDGDTFSMTQKNTFFHHSAALSGATIDGHVENVTPAGPTHKATMSIIFDDIKLSDGTMLPIAAIVSAIKPPTHHIRDAGLIVGGAVAGHMMAAKMHGGMAGAAAGFALATTLKSDIYVKTGTTIKMKLAHDIVDTGPAPASTST